MSRKVLKDPVTTRRVRNAALLSSAGVAAFGGWLAWSYFQAKSGEADAVSWVTCFSLMALLVLVANVFYAYGVVKWFYRCPRCRGRVQRVPESRAGAAIRYLCVRCNVEWDTGWHVSGPN